MKETDPNSPRHLPFYIYYTNIKSKLFPADFNLVSTA